ncbi:hypothetical protein E4U35_003150 [Claviceps purpurea]|nr:hypothetical protein E4U35_003150 [Claviceps purpurea]
MDANTNPGTHPSWQPLATPFYKDWRQTWMPEWTLWRTEWALETGIRTPQTNMTTLETNIINKLDTFMAIMTARSTEVDEKFAKYDKKIDAVRKNATARLDNRMSGSSDPDSSVTTLRG